MSDGTKKAIVFKFDVNKKEDGKLIDFRMDPERVYPGNIQLQREYSARMDAIEYGCYRTIQVLNILINTLKEVNAIIAPSYGAPVAIALEGRKALESCLVDNGFKIVTDIIRTHAHNGANLHFSDERSIRKLAASEDIIRKISEGNFKDLTVAEKTQISASLTKGIAIANDYLASVTHEYDKVKSSLTEKNDEPVKEKSSSGWCSIV